MHTQGPWQCYADVPSVDPNWHIVTSDSRLRVLANVHIEPGNEMDAANARLITAAPDLLSAAKAVVEQWDTPNWKLEQPTASLINALRSVIAKVEAD
jgi:hypothetical protein